MTCNLLFLQLEECIFFVLFGVDYFQVIKQKVYLLPENFDQLSNLKNSSLPVFLVLIDINSS